MSLRVKRRTDLDQPVIYRIKIKGRLGLDWTEMFTGLAITVEDEGETILAGPMADQAALYGVLRKIRDMGMSLVSVNS